MALSMAAIRTTIKQLMEATIGTYQTTMSTMFAYGAFDGQPDEAIAARAMQTASASHVFDVAVDSVRSHASSNQSNRSSRRIAEMDVRIPVYTYLPTEAQQTARDTTLATIFSDLEDAAQALGTPGNLAQTSAAVTTGIIGGLMRGPDNAGVPEITVVPNWPKRWVRSELRGSLLVDVARNED